MTRIRRLTPEAIREAERRRAEALADRETRSRHAWKSPFQQKLALAKSRLPSTKARTEKDRQAVKDLIRDLQKLASGRPSGPSVAERAAADLYVGMNREWREETGRPRVTQSVMKVNLDKAIERAAFMLCISKSAIRADEIRRLARRKK